MLSDEDRLAIAAVHREWVDAELKGDMSAVLQLCTAEPVWLPPDHGPLCGRAAIVRWLAAQPHEGVVRIDIDRLAIDGLDSFAWKVATFRTTLDRPAATGPSVFAGAHGWLLQRDDAGTWRVAVVTWTTARPDHRRER
ncbi:SnoaL-like domain protein [Luteitalea pratensis]|uniref:SnoaL-like domain protein n=1 Tax=Luteitalea pratensis TaxID=1855912 RepID=A0A143PIQ1_LUTPR|nr:nuclear transport factor 2 family protein [Luteitalea pratensis]AMY08381.1 SnoaL-like domain protein [Luteitalea pratensis]